MMNFKTMNLVQKVDFLSDLLGEAIFSVNTVHYQKLTSEEQAQVKELFFSDLKDAEVEVTDVLLNAVLDTFQDSPMADMLIEFKAAQTVEIVHESFKTAVNELQADRKVTIFKFNEFGWPVMYQTRIKEVDVTPYAQYKESLIIKHVPKGKRSLRGNRVLPMDEFIVYEGWIDFDIDELTYNIETKSEEVTVKRSKYTCFDRNYFADLKQAINKEMLVCNCNN